LAVFLYALTLPNINRFSQLFHCQNREKNKFVITLKIPPHLMCVALLPCEISSVLKATTENKTTFVTTHFKKLTTGNHVFIVSVIVQNNCHILQFLHQMFNMLALLLDDTLKPATPLTNSTINETLQHTLDISQGSVATHLKCDWIFSDSITINFLPILKYF